MDSTLKFVALIVTFLVVGITVHARNCGTIYQKTIQTEDLDDHVASPSSEVKIKEVIAAFKIFVV